MRRFRDLPIGRKVTLLILLATALALGLASVGVIVYEVTTVRPRATRDLRSQAAILRANTAAALSFDDPRAAAENLATLRARSEIPKAALYDAQRRRFAIFVEVPGDSASLPARPAPVGLDVDGASLVLTEPVTTDGEVLGYLMLWYSPPSLWARLPQYGIMVAVVLGSLLAVALLLAWLLRTSLSRPLRTLSSTAQAIAERRDYQARAEKHGDDELGQLTDAFNAMLATIEAREAALRESAERLGEALRAAKMASWVWNPADDTITWGGAEARLFGETGIPRGPSLDALLERVHPEDREGLATALRRAPRSDTLVELAFRTVDDSGRVYWFALRGRAIVEDGGAVRVVGLIQDVTDRRQLEEQLRQAQKMEAVGQLAGGIAHDFNNLLTAINGYAEFVLRGLRAGDPITADVREIKLAGERAAALTRQLLAFSRKQMLQPQLLDPTQVLADLGRMLRRLVGEHIDLRVHARPGVAWVRVDRSSLEQVIINLVVNARDAMPQGGRLTIEARAVALDPGYADRHVGVLPGEYVLIAVSDTGHGMDEATRARIFEPFFTTKGVGKGTGLGLAMVYGTIRQSGGTVEVYSAPGLGTTFKLYLPRHGGAGDELAASVDAASPRGDETVLIVEDEPAVLAFTARALEAHGYRVLTAGHPDEALRLLDEASPAPDLLLVDVVMPGRNGRQTAELAVARHPTLKVLYMSGYTDDAVVANGVLEATAAFLQKPFPPDVLVRRVRETLDGRGR